MVFRFLFLLFDGVVTCRQVLRAQKNLREMQELGVRSSRGLGVGISWIFHVESLLRTFKRAFNYPDGPLEGGCENEPEIRCALYKPGSYPAHHRSCGEFVLWDLC